MEELKTKEDYKRKARQIYERKRKEMLGKGAEA